MISMPDVAVSVAILCNALTSGCLSPALVDVFAGGILIPLAKTSPGGTNVGVRPIALTCALRRIVGKIAMRRLNSSKRLQDGDSATRHAADSIGNHPRPSAAAVRASAPSATAATTTADERAGAVVAQDFRVADPYDGVGAHSGLGEAADLLGAVLPPAEENPARPASGPDVGLGDANSQPNAGASILARETLLESHFGVLQMGVSRRGGCEIINTALRAALVLNPQHVVIKLDIKNAFNALHRDAIFAQLEAKFKPLFPMVKQLYSVEGRLRVSVRGLWESVKSSDGAQQGDPLGPFLFCVGIQPLLQEVHEEFRERMEAASGFFIFYIDDGYICAPPDIAKAVFDRLAERLAAVGLQVNAAKTTVYSLEPLGGSAGQQPVPGAKYMSRSRDEGFDVLGGSLGSEVWIQSNLLHKIVDVKLHFEKIVMEDGVTLQNKWLMFKVSIAAEFQHVLRLVPPGLIKRDLPPQLRKFASENGLTGSTVVDAWDNFMVGCVRHLFELHTASAEGDALTAIQRAAFFLPLHLGGLGLPESRCIAEPAYLASFALCASTVASVVPALRDGTASDGNAPAGGGEMGRANRERVARELGVYAAGAAYRSFVVQRPVAATVAAAGASAAAAAAAVTAATGVSAVQASTAGAQPRAAAGPGLAADGSVAATVITDEDAIVEPGFFDPMRHFVSQLKSSRHFSLQSRLVHHFYDVVHRRLLGDESIPVVDRARLLSAGGTGGGQWTLIVPSDQCWKADDATFRVMMRFRLGWPLDCLTELVEAWKAKCELVGVAEAEALLKTSLHMTGDRAQATTTTAVGGARAPGGRGGRPRGGGRGGASGGGGQARGGRSVGGRPAGQPSRRVIGAERRQQRIEAAEEAGRRVMDPARLLAAAVAANAEHESDDDGSGSAARLLRGGGGLSHPAAAGVEEGGGVSAVGSIADGGGPNGISGARDDGASSQQETAAAAQGVLAAAQGGHGDGVSQPTRGELGARLRSILDTYRGLRTCSCKSAIFDVYGYHICGCTKALFGGANRRHDVCVRLIDSYCRSAGLEARMEATGYFRGNCKSDIVFYDPATNRLTHIDTVVTCASNVSNSELCQQRRFAPGCIAAMWELEKIKKYESIGLNDWKPIARGAGRNFYPAAIETHGCFGSSVKELLSMLARRTSERREHHGCGDHRSVIHLRMIRELSFAVAFNTARGIMQHVRWAAEALGLSKRKDKQPSHLESAVLVGG